MCFLFLDIFFSCWSPTQVAAKALATPRNNETQDFNNFDSKVLPQREVMLSYILSKCAAVLYIALKGGSQRQFVWKEI